MLHWRRGVALATALSLVALILTIGLALGTVSVMSLHLSRRSFLETRAVLQARSGVAEFISQVNVLESGRTIQLFNPQPVDLTQSFAHSQLVDGCWISFDRSETRGYCTDNSDSANWAQSWLDRDTSRTSLPPYTIELILHSSVAGYRHDYRALLRRVWDYAIYSAHGPIVLTGDPSQPGQGSHVQGNVYAYLDNFSQVLPITPTSDPSHANSLQFWRWMNSTFQPDVSTTFPVEVGPPGNTSPGYIVGPLSPFPDQTGLLGSRYQADILPGPSTIQSYSGSSSLEGSVYYSDSDHRQGLAPLVGPGSSWSGSVAYKAPAHDPLGDFTFQLSGTDMPVSGFVEGAADAYNALGMGFIMFPIDQLPSPLPNNFLKYLLWEDWNSGNASWYRLDRSLSNRVVLGTASTLRVVEFPCGLDLKNCVLTINGDLDISDVGVPGFHGIKGDGATLIVNGTLALSGGRLDAGDQGMVVLAKDVALGGSGDYRGVIIGLNSVSISPKAGERFSIRGGILSGGHAVAEGHNGVVLRNVDLVQDNRYMKSLNSYGDLRLTAWETL